MVVSTQPIGLARILSPLFSLSIITSYIIILQKTHPWMVGVLE